ncbi:MAG: RDD family protein [Bacteroidota bacterium]|nr:RDD family protein [Bacteroidota bacterium]
MENPTLVAPSVTNQTYAGFWIRFVALIIDYIIIYVVQAFLVVPLLAMMGIATLTPSSDVQDVNQFALASAMMVPLMIVSLFTLVLSWLYFAFMESSPRQATLGKLAVGIIVTDLQGNRISFLQASGRFFSKIISAMILYIGYIMAAFTEKKQALHDMIASTLVLKK